MGKMDKTIRLIAVAIILGLYALGYISGTIGILLLVVAIIFAVTSIVNFCPLYTLFGLNTCKVKTEK